MKVRVDHDRDGWYYAADGLKSDRQATYAEAVRRAVADGHEIDNGGWRYRMLAWNFNGHAIDGYPGWEIGSDGGPAFLKMSHERGKEESHAVAVAWDDIATADFYQRDWTKDGIPFVRDGETYWSGWWFATIAERERFLRWRSEAALQRRRIEWSTEP